jgi:hypothetical protein
MDLVRCCRRRISSFSGSEWSPSQLVEGECLTTETSVRYQAAAGLFHINFLQLTANQSQKIGVLKIVIEMIAIRAH